MTKREKLIKGLKCCTRIIVKCYECPYYDDNSCDTTLMSDALELLKAQEPRNPHYTILKYRIDGMEFSVKHPECPKCWESGLALWDAEISRGDKYCKRCGQAVKWDG